MLLLRSLLFMPGNQARMLEKGTRLFPDAYIPDMEDSVPPEEKSIAREVTSRYLDRLSNNGPLVIPRVNSLDSGFLEDDLETLIRPSIFGVSVGKIHDAGDIVEISKIIRKIEDIKNLSKGSIKLIPWIETAKSIINCYEICTSSPRIVAAAFGAEDFTDDMGIERTSEETEIRFARNSIAVAARAADVLALDTPYFSFKDAEGLKLNALKAKNLGFKGKFAIHPDQVKILNESFAPSKSEIDYAKEVITVFDEAVKNGRGSTSLRGEVIDIPVVKRAKNLLRFADVLESDERPTNGK